MSYEEFYSFPKNEIDKISLRKNLLEKLESKFYAVKDLEREFGVKVIVDKTINQLVKEGIAEIRYRGPFKIVGLTKEYLEKLKKEQNKED